jgi:tRNA-dihydrouridine synthase B
LGFWEYFAQSFDNPQKVYKKIKKASNIQKYQVTVTEILAHKEFKGF